MERKIKSISWSKIHSFENYKQQFIKQYFEWEKFYETKEVIFWKVLWAIIELNTFETDEIITHLSKDRNGDYQEIEERVLKLIHTSIEKIAEDTWFCDNLIKWQFDLFPQYEEYIQSFVQTSLVEWVWSICCLWFIDNSSAIDENLQSFREFKTGKTPWTQERANEHGQLYFYAMLIESKTGQLPKKAYLDWIITTENENGEIVPHWDIQTFEVEIKKEKVETLKKKLPIIFNQMQEEYEKWLDSQEWQINLNIENIEEYAALQRSINMAQERQKELKQEIDQDLQKNKVENYKLKWAGSFFYTQRKKWDYPEEITTKEAKITEETKEKMKTVDQLKVKYEEKHEPQTTTSLSFRLWK